MQFHLFQYPIPNDADLSDLNRFLAANRIVSVHRDIVSTNGGPVLLFTVETAAGNVPDDTRAKRVDYREILSTDEFALFDRLRDVRKALAEAESVPLFGIFNNAQLAPRRAGTL